MMMSGRRAFLTGCAAAGGWVASGMGSSINIAAGAAPEGLEDFGFIGPEDDPEFGSLISGTAPKRGAPVATGRSRHDEVAKAFRILFDVPRGGDQMEIARYFEKLGEKNGDGELYNAEWSTVDPELNEARANPVIVGFFSMTNTKPAAGDYTPWCAAFVNFCLYAAGKQTTFSALSGKFRSYGEPTGDPKPGDVVVFAKHGERGRQGFGHVGFFEGYNDDKITVLGGNQRGTTGTTGAVTLVDHPRDGRDLVLHSFRQVRG